MSSPLPPLSAGAGPLSLCELPLPFASINSPLASTSFLLVRGLMSDAVVISEAQRVRSLV